MKSTGITRQVDTLGRVVLPKELRRNLGLDVNDAMEIYVDGESIILKKYHPSCIFCDEVTDVVSYNGKMICRSCLAKLAEEAAK
ncbi:MAG: AbrB/MazE/SpoVT family DNA-binding domain-containing protein [Firmicutes bacterium]|nr:AbrB/MazE/SpoVT family DNA-binding domain-containing protein [Bacillota bacterium]